MIISSLFLYIDHLVIIDLWGNIILKDLYNIDSTSYVILLWSTITLPEYIIESNNLLSC